MRRRNNPSKVAPDTPHENNDDIAAAKIQAMVRGKGSRTNQAEVKMNALIRKVMRMNEKINLLSKQQMREDSVSKQSTVNYLPPLVVKNEINTSPSSLDKEDDKILLSDGKTDKNINKVEEGKAGEGEGEGNEDDEDGYTLGESMWDVSILLGILPDDEVGSLYCAMLLCMNIGIQVIFSFILVQILTQPEFSDDTILGFRSWRRNIAHSSQFMEDLTQVSLASRVCSQDSGLELSSSQAQAHGDLQGYLNNKVGILMCALTLFLWIVTVIKEVQSAISFIQALWLVPRENNKFFSDEKNSSIVGISDIRRSLIFIVQLFRLAIVVTLGIVGITWLGNTVSVTDLVLNAVALEFVLCVDEILFEALAPKRMKKLIEGLGESPLPLPASKEYKGLDFNALLLFLTVFAVSLISIFVVAIPFENRLKLADDALCAGEQNFVYAINAAGIPAWASSEHYEPRIGSAPPKKSFGHNKWDLEDTHSKEKQLLKKKEDERMNFATKMIDNLIAGYSASEVANSDCGEVVYYKLENQSRTFPFRPDINGILEISFCESEYYTGLIDINGKEVELFTEEQTHCCLAQQIRTPNIFGGRVSIKGFETETISTAMDIWNPGCVDIIGRLPTDDPIQTEMIYPFTNLLAGSFGDTLDGTCGVCPAHRPFCDPSTKQCRNMTCEDVKPYCTNDTTTGIRARQFCPVTCNCHNPYSKQVLNSPEYGCPATCEEKEFYDEAMNNRTCEDVAANSSLITKHLNNIDSIVSLWPGLWREQWETMISPIFVAMGCPAVDMIKSIGVSPFDFCTFGGSLWPVKPISYLCPITCGCDETMVWGCPNSCES
jgi:hypothetical protein